jgi:hypothetical protein
MAIAGTYGRGQMLGAGVDPSFFRQDFSGFVKAAETEAAGQQALVGGIVKGIGSAVEGFVEKKKEQKENEKLIQKSDTVAKSIAQLIPELAPTIEESRAILSDLNVPQERRLAEAEAIRDVLGLGISEVRNRQEIALKQGELGLQSRRLGLEQARAITEAEALQSKPPSTIEVPDGKGGQILMQFDPQTRTYVPLDVTLPAGAPNPDTWQRPTSAKGIKVDNITDANRFVAPGGLVDTSYLNVINKVPTDYNIENPLLPTLEQAENPASSPYYGMPGYTPPKQENKFVSAPPEVAAQYGATAGQIDLTTGRFYPINPPSGFELVTDEQGVKTFRQGPGVGTGRGPQIKVAEGQMVEYDEGGQPIRIVDIPGGRAASEEEEKELGKENFSLVMSNMTNNFVELDRMDGIVNPDKPATLNIASRVAASAAGQMVGGTFGTEAQALRDRIVMAKPALIGAIMKATGMSSRQMDSNRELQFYLQQVGDETKSIWANLAAIDLLDKQYGNGKLIDGKFGDNPDALSKIRKEAQTTTSMFSKPKTGSRTFEIPKDLQEIIDMNK